MEILDRLLAHLPDEPAIVALSGGVDSAVVLAGLCLKGVDALAVTCASAALSARSRHMAETVAHHLGARHIVLDTFETRLLPYRQNGPDRCFACKNHLYGRLSAFARESNAAHLLDGTHLDDLDDSRPGRRAAQLWHVDSPLLEAGLHKDDVRSVASRLSLPNATLPADSCLASRVDRGIPVTDEVLKRIEAGEAILAELGFTGSRLRYHGDLCRIEVPLHHLAGTVTLAGEIVRRLAPLGFTYVTLDLEGYRPAGMRRRL